MKKNTTLYSFFIIGAFLFLQSCADKEEQIPEYLDLLTEISVLDYEPIMTDTFAIKSYRVAASKLTGTVVVNATDGPYSLSKSQSGDYNSSLTFEPQELAGGPATIYVKFDPTEEGTFNGQITHTTEGLTTSAVVQVKGTAILDISDIGDLLMNEQFAYPAGDIPSNDRTNDGDANAELPDWVKVRPANAGIKVYTPGLEFAGYSGSGIGNAARIDNTRPGNIYAYNLSEQQDDEFEGSFYVSAMIRVDAYPAAGQFNRPVMFVDWIAETGATDFLSAIQVGNNDGDIKFGIKYGPVDGMSAVTPEIGKTYLVVLKHTVTDTDPNNDNNTASLYIIDAEIPATEPETPDATMITSVSDSKKVKAITLVNDNSASSLYVVDGLKVAKTWEDLFK